MYEWAMKCQSCGEIDTSDKFPNNADICFECQGEVAPDQMTIPFDEEGQA
jgi:hypothetical protein